MKAFLFASISTLLSLPVASQKKIEMLDTICHVKLSGDTLGATILFNVTALDRLEAGKCVFTDNIAIVFSNAKKIDFAYSRFEKELFIDQTELDSTNFHHCVFHGDVNLANNEYKRKTSYCDFSYSVFKEGSNVSIDRPAYKINFSNVRIYGEVNLSGGGEYIPNLWSTYIDLRGTDVSKIKLNSNFKLFIDDDYLYYEEYCSIYESLLKNYSDRGQHESYKHTDIDYQKFKDRSFFKWKSKLYEWWWNFGYDYKPIFIHILHFLLLFTSITYFFLKELQQHVYSVSAIAEAPHIDRVIRIPSFKRIWYAFSYSSIVFLLLTLKIEHLKLKAEPKYIIGTCYVLLMHLTGLFCIGFLVKFVLHM